MPLTRAEQLAQFLDERIRFTRAPVWPTYAWNAGWNPYAVSRPTAEQLANELLAVPEFQALRLGTWLGTTDGQIIAQAVEMVSPPFYRDDIELLVEALTTAARMQSETGQQKAGAFALCAIGIAALIAIAGSSGRAA